MRVFFALFLLAMSVSVIGCARRNQATYVDLPPEAPPHTSDVKLASVSAPTPPAKPKARVAVDNSPRTPPKEPSKKPSDAPIANKGKGETAMSLAAVQAKVRRVGVEHLTQSDIEGLSYDQIQELRGY